MLSAAEIDAFLADGYVAIRGAVPGAVARACQDVVWSELEKQRIVRDDPATWTAAVVRINCPDGGPFAAAGQGTVPVLAEACDQLIGAGRWWRRPGVGGTIPVRFPGEQDPGDAGWHFESSYEAGGSWRVNIGSRARGLLALYLITDVDADGAPTRLRPGSHLDVPPILEPAGDDGLDWSVAAPLAAQASAHRPTALATGRAGDVFLCHPFLVHAASWPHRGSQPRMIAQPGVALHGQFPLDPDASPSPVERAILTGLAGAGRGPASFRAGAGR
ncbi:MAG TPA: phytanoyl-CoA dioxygenase family protein [Streptosporangiaceae bacterium]|nr:phytanoyl-CoA dioxygenase family protein [Streptosporangiaceae bacterium]